MLGWVELNWVGVLGWHYIKLNWIELELNYIFALHWIVLKFHCSRLPGSWLKDWDLYCIVLHCMFCIVLHCIALHCIALYFIVLHCVALYCIVLHCIALHYIVLKFHCSRLSGSCLKVPGGVGWGGSKPITMLPQLRLG